MSVDQNGTRCAETGREVLVIEPQPRRQTFMNGNYRPSASFVAQVIAAKTGAPTYRAKRRASTFEAQSAYTENDKRKIVRMPMGYLRTLSA